MTMCSRSVPSDRMIEGPVDFAIIVALKVEREAIVRRLNGAQVIQDDGEPLTYYVGILPVPGEEQPFTVVVTQLIEMGNPDAAIATTRAIERWRPRNVLMVGIAGGVKAKVALGDVVVSQYAHYYEPAKRTRDGVEHRDRQFNSDLLLYGWTCPGFVDTWVKPPMLPGGTAARTSWD
jgi:hypothetical protein